MENSIFQTLSHRLNDLSSKNKSLYLPRVADRGFVDIQDLDYLHGSPAFQLVSGLISKKKSLQLIPELDPRLAEVNQLSKQLAKISFRDQLTQEESGDQGLFLAWPFVEGKLISGQVLRAPILLWPCELEKNKGYWQLNRRRRCQWNTDLILAYARANGLKIDLDYLDDRLDVLSSDPMVFRTELNGLLDELFKFQLSAALFEDRLTPFPLSQVSIDAVKFKEGKLQLKTYAILGQFIQKGSALLADYEELMKRYPQGSLEAFFERGFAKGEEKAGLREEQVFTVFPMDASQEEVFGKVRQGKSLTVQGPPGTGKSQLIANLAADYTARGKKVLIVSQKRAALDVVYARLKEVGFEQFLGLVHDFRGDQKALFAKLKQQIEAIEGYQEQNRGLDAIHLEREMSVQSRTIGRLSARFEELRTALADTQVAGISPKQLYLQGRPGKVGSEERQLLLRLDLNAAREFEKELRIFFAYQNKFQFSFWGERKSFAGYQPSDFQRIRQLLESLESYSWTEMPADWNVEEIKGALLQTETGSVRLDEMAKGLESLGTAELAVDLFFERWSLADLKALRSAVEQLQDRVGAFQFSLPENLPEILTEFESIQKIAASGLKRLFLRFYKNRFPYTRHWLETNSWSFSHTGLQKSQAALEQLTEVQRELDMLPLKFDLKFSLFDLNKSLQTLESMSAWLEKKQSVPGLMNWLDWKKLIGDDGLSDELRRLSVYFGRFEEDFLVWNQFLTKGQIMKLLNHQESVCSPQLMQDFGDLIGFDGFLEGWANEQLGRMYHSMLPEGEVEPAICLFWEAWSLAWIEELEQREPILREAGSVRLEQEMRELKEAILQKQKLARELALMRLRERTWQQLVFNRLGNRLTYRDLLHQVGKKRQKWPVRKLIQEFEEEIFRLIPCWLASPETVSAIFPLESRVDVVIFDEASQCAVERGLPAMLRGRQVVVVGDQKQLRPSDFYQVRWESEEEGMEYEAESLLELASGLFENTMLKGHYRSVHPALIAFSNEKFYGGKLEMLPGYQVMQRGKYPLSWQKVDGIWENQINGREAEAVLDQVRSLRTSAPLDSVGIVTGNYFQMELIRETLWKAGIHDSRIKVRNIENVQGDEFDQVVLSLGYAPNSEGKLVTNFGLLGKSGAENRLNVAITRARKHMHVISSIDPEDFRESQLKNPGLVLLRAFLSYAKAQANHPNLVLEEISHPKFELDWSLKNKLLENDSTYSNQVPSSVMDLVKGEGVLQVAILTDDQRFFDAPSAKAALAYHPILLESKGWKWEWRWSRDQFFSGQ